MIQLRRPPKLSHRSITNRLREELPKVYSFGLFDGLAADLGIEDAPPREEQIDFLNSLAPSLIHVREAKKVDALVQSAIRAWLRERSLLSGG